LFVSPRCSIRPASGPDKTAYCTQPVIHCILEHAAKPWRRIAGMAETPAQSRSANWLWIAAIWFGVGLIDASQTVFPMRAQGMHHAWVRLFVMLVASWLPWALATPLVMDLGRRYPPFRASIARALPIHLGVLAAIGLATAAWSALLEIQLNPWAQPPPLDSFTNLWLTKFSYGVLTSLIVYGFILAIAFAVDSRDRMARQKTATAQLNEQLSKAQLAALRQQLDPHFMFNTLNAISGLVRDNRNDAAVDMIAGLSDFLRRAAEDSDRPQVALGAEVEYLKRFLDIQKVRFAERLQVSLEIPEELLHAPVPNLILQPLVENAIKHGIAKRAGGGAIRVAGSRANGRLSLSVYNDGPCLNAARKTTSAGIGLANLRTRMAILYGSDFELILRNGDGGGVEVLVSLPLREW
jgi:two-component system LytT family sensor kinase